MNPYASYRNAYIPSLEVSIPLINVEPLLLHTRDVGDVDSLPRLYSSAPSELTDRMIEPWKDNGLMVIRRLELIESVPLVLNPQMGVINLPIVHVDLPFLGRSLRVITPLKVIVVSGDPTIEGNPITISVDPKHYPERTEEMIVFPTLSPYSQAGMPSMDVVTQLMTQFRFRHGWYRLRRWAGL